MLIVQFHVCLNFTQYYYIHLTALFQDSLGKPAPGW